ncbi:MAG: hypothetical protein CVV59_01655 [Tenericutes bacterium HGW-Tenericutes-4]|nr:MAG: hypothetical protein CVV59_01655 [Tenericutes bacterium HGW-Tenericutes-4]
MKNLALTQILKNALEGKEGFDKIINSRDEKIAKMIYSSLENINSYYEKKYKTKETNNELSKEVVAYYYGKDEKILKDSEETRNKKNGELSSRIYKYFMQSNPSNLTKTIETSAKKYMTIETEKTLFNKTYAISFAKMPEAKVENLERISNFFEKHNIRDEKQIEADIQELA